MLALPHSTAGWPARIVNAAGGRAHLTWTGLLSLLLSVLAGVGCALLAPGSHVVVTSFGDLPAWPQDEVRIEAEVWFTIVLSAVAVVTTVLWWRPFGRRTEGPVGHRGGPGGAQRVEEARGPIGLGIAAAAAMVQTGVAMLVWHPVIALRGFAGPGAVGEDRIAAPVLSSATSLWVAALCAVLTYLVLVVLAPTSSLKSKPRPTQSPT